MASLAHRLRDRLVVEEAVDVDNGQGGRDESWQPLGGEGAPQSKLSAEVYGLSGSEAMRAGIERAVNQWRVTLRRRDDITSQHRFRWLNGGNVVLAIKSVMRDPKDPQNVTLALCESGAID
jgi:head-tail adaptor